MRYEIWSEGHGAQGAPMQAQLLAVVEAENFNAAVEHWRDTDYDPKRWGALENINGRWYTWGCELFDNEADARKNFG